MAIQLLMHLSHSGDQVTSLGSKICSVILFASICDPIRFGVLCFTSHWFSLFSGPSPDLGYGMRRIRMVCAISSQLGWVRGEPLQSCWEGDIGDEAALQGVPERRGQAAECIRRSGLDSHLVHLTLVLLEHAVPQQGRPEEIQRKYP